jgi:hypothetical protein
MSKHGNPNFSKPKRPTRLKAYEYGSRQAAVALLSQVLVAFTLELDNEFERRMNGTIIRLLARQPG